MTAVSKRSVPAPAGSATVEARPLPPDRVAGVRARLRGERGSSLCPAWFTTRPLVADSFLAAVLGVVTVAMVLNFESAFDTSVLTAPSGAGDWLLLLGPVLFVSIRRVAPTVAVLGGALAQAVMWLTELPDNYVAMTVLLFSAAADGGRRSRRAAWFAAGALPTFTLLGAATAEVPIYAVLVVALMSVAAVAIGGSMTRREAYLAAVEARAVDAERSRRAERDRALSEERNRIARELHDVVAHGLSVVVVQAGAAQRTLDRDPAATRDALEQIEETGRTALREMRHVLAVIRTDPDESWRPAPGLAGLHELIDDLAKAGLDVTLNEHVAEDLAATDVRADLGDLPATVDLTAYRVVQESLTNVLKHGGRNVTANVEVIRTPGSLDLTIVDNGNGAAAADDGGHGLRGMQERVEVFGGDFAAGPRVGGGFAVRVSLPLAGSDSAP